MTARRRRTRRVIGRRLDVLRPSAPVRFGWYSNTVPGPNPSTVRVVAVRWRILRLWTR